MSFITKSIMIAIAIILPFSGGWIIGLIWPRNFNDPWYNGLIQPSYNPPAWVFPIAWTFLYCSIGIASYLVYAKLVASGRGLDQTAQIALASYAIQLALNWAWTPIFFNYHSLKWAAIEGTVLTISIIVNAFVFRRIHRVAGLLFVPYIAWSLFAKALAWHLYILND